MATKPIYTSTAALKPVLKVLDECGKALADPNRTIKFSDIPEVLGAATGAMAGSGAGFAAVYFAGITGLSGPGITSGLAALGHVVGGGAVAGIGVAAFPAVVLSVGGYALLSRMKRKKLVEQKEMILQEALRKRDAVLNQLRADTEANSERLEYLESLNVVLRAIINDLQSDLALAV
jgi:hypothetical protein